jgi:hypothetical protein
MKKFLNFINIVFGLLLIALIGWGVIAFLRLYWQSVTSLEPNLASAIIAASATLIVAVLTVVIGKYYERKQEIENQQREKKIEVYEQFMEKWFDKLLVMSKSKDKNKNVLDDEEFVQFLSEFTRKLILWGSNDVVKKYSSFRQGSLTPTQDSSPYAVLYNFEQVLFEIRKDIGHSNQTLKPGDLLTLFINDLQQATKKSKGK